MPENSKTVPLYRIENPNITARPDGVTSHADLVGQWFTPKVDTAMNYLRKSTQTFGPDAHPVDGAQLVVAEVPADLLNAYHVSGHPIASQMDVENDNYILPVDGSIPMQSVPLDPVIGDLRGKLGRLDKRQEAGARIREVLGLVAIEN